MTGYKSRATAYSTKKPCQRIMQKKGFTGIRHYIDDGISSTTIEREGLQSMLADVEKGNIGTIIVKGMSCLGRNNVEMVCFGKGS